MSCIIETTLSERNNYVVKICLCNTSIFFHRPKIFSSNFVLRRNFGVGTELSHYNFLSFGNLISYELSVVILISRQCELTQNTHEAITRTFFHPSKFNVCFFLFLIFLGSIRTSAFESHLSLSTCSILSFGH